MDCADLPSWISLAAQIPLVGIFIWFTLEVMNRTQHDQEKRDDQWRAFLKEQRESNNAATARLAEEIKAISGVIQAINNLMIVHDQRVITALPEMREAYDQRNSEK